MTHDMWIFRCISKHHRTKGKLVLDSKAKLFKEIERQLAMGEDAFAEEDKWMLEVDITQVRDSSLERSSSSDCCMQWRQPNRLAPALWS